MNVRSLVGNVTVAFVAQAVTLVTSIVVTLLVPRLLDVENFGYWQLFLFYSSYAGFFMLGLNDGCYLQNGGICRRDLDKPSVNSQFLVGLFFEVAVGITLALIVAFGTFGSERSYVLWCFSLFIPLRCSAAFLGYVFQAVNETKLYSWSCVLERLAFLGMVLALIMLGSKGFQWYIVAYCLSTTIQFVYCCWHAWDILTSGHLPVSDAMAQASASVRIGIKLMLANIASTLIVGVARAAIDSVWGISSFGQLSLALSLCNFFLAFVSQFAMVLFPALRQSSRDEIKTVTSFARYALSFIMPSMYLMYFPLYMIFMLWLPKYGQGLSYMALMLPICVFDSKTSLCCFTYFKVARMEARMLRINCITVLLCSLGVAVGAYAFNSMNLVIVAAVMGVIGRNIYCERVVYSELGLVEDMTIVVSEIMLTCVFVAAHYLANLSVSAVVCLVAYAMYVGINNRSFKEVFMPVLKRLHIVKH